MQRVVIVYRWLSGMLHSAHNYFTDLNHWAYLWIMAMEPDV